MSSISFINIIRFTLFCVFSLASFGFAASLKELTAAMDMDGQKGITLLSSSIIVFKVLKDGYNTDYEYIDEDGGWEIENRVKKSETKPGKCEGWTVQSGPKWNVLPVKGKSCLRSDLPTDCNKDSDAQLARLVFKVYGPGTFSFLCRTATAYGDSVNVYVDGEISPDTPAADGYGSEAEYGWGYAADDKDKEDYRGLYSVNIEEGVAPEGSAYAGTYFHEIRLEFEKDLPQYDTDENDKVYYVKDGPDPDDVEYEEIKDYFRNCVWIDDVSWEPAPVTFAFEEDNEFENVATVFIATNAASFGYMVKYTTDGTNPVKTSLDYDFENGIVLLKDATLKASVFYKDVADMNGNGNTTEILKYTNGDVDVDTLNVRIKATAPSIAVDETLSTDKAVAIVISKGYEANVIRYTTDGTDPTDGSPVYDAPIMLTEPKTIKAICTRDGITSSEVTSFEFGEVEKPSIAIDKDLSTDLSVAVVLSTDNEFSVIKYTLDGTEPTVQSPVYESPIMLTEPKTVKAICALYGVIPSESVAIEPSVLEKPSVRPVNATDDSLSFWVTTSNTLKVVATAEEGASVKYGAAGDISINYDGEITMNAANRQTLSFQAVSIGKLPSEIVTVTAYKADKSFYMDGLELGWNLVSIPITLTPESIKAALKAHAFYVFDKKQGCYLKAATLEEGRAYWIFGTQDSLDSFTLRGTVIGTMQFDSGWTLAGPVLMADDEDEGMPIPDDVKVFKYQNGKFQVETEMMWPGIGYWIYK